MGQGRPTVVLDIGTPDPTDPHRERIPDFISIDWSWRTMAYTIRLQLQLDGVNDMEGRTFDFWFERLKTAAASGDNTRVAVYLAQDPENPAISIAPASTTTSYRGLLCKTGDLQPRLCPGNERLFEFSLCEVERSETIRVKTGRQ